MIRQNLRTFLPGFVNNNLGPSSAAERSQFAAHLLIVLSQRIAMPQNALIQAKRFLTRFRHLEKLVSKSRGVFRLSIGGIQRRLCAHQFGQQPVCAKRFVHCPAVACLKCAAQSVGPIPCHEPHLRRRTRHLLSQVVGFTRLYQGDVGPGNDLCKKNAVMYGPVQGQYRANPVFAR